jgi:hypothetical protein
MLEHIPKATLSVQTEGTKNFRHKAVRTGCEKNKLTSWL